jgi:signal transduction histidine kinase/DNA-binding response OmpR family regulator
VFTVVIRQPWYNTWWAWLIYLFIIGVLCWHFYRSWRRNFELDQQIRMEKELSTFRLNFFTHIAHEFRTPLAIISGAADKLTQKGNEAQVSRSAVQTVRRGTLRLTKLVNQLMEFRRINTGNQRLAVVEDDIIKLARTTCDEFREVAARKDQSLTFTPFAHQHRLTFDPHLIETILYNLLSNAIKYTPQGGSISLKAKLTNDQQQLQLIVEDSGPGISDLQIPQLYQPFMHGYVSQGGMGIGLYTAYQSALLHKGRLAYERISAEGGSRFIVTIPATADVYSADDYAGATAVNTQYEPEPTPDHIRELAPVAFNENYTVAIIEDDPDMLDQIRESVGRYFRTISYTEGQKALSDIGTQQPSMILCDVMLPDVNGFEIVRQLRAAETTQNIPIIMLTALDGDDQLLRGYKAGADDYMVKPCNFELLVLRITQLIKWYSRIQPTDENSMVNGQSSMVNVKVPIITDEADQRFREKMETIVAQRLGDADFNVDTLASLLKMGRTKFYGKMKEFTGMSPNSYLQNERLKRAAELLIEGDLNVTEVSYKVGFQSPTYFYKCFKEKYGVPPSKFGKGEK